MARRLEIVAPCAVITRHLAWRAGHRVAPDAVIVERLQASVVNLRPARTFVLQLRGERFVTRTDLRPLLGPVIAIEVFHFPEGFLDIAPERGFERGALAHALQRVLFYFVQRALPPFCHFSGPA